MAAASSPFISLIFLLFLAVAAELKPSPQRDNKQVCGELPFHHYLHSLFTPFILIIIFIHRLHLWFLLFLLIISALIKRYNETDLTDELWNSKCSICLIGCCIVRDDLRLTAQWPGVININESVQDFSVLHRSVTHNRKINVTLKKMSSVWCFKDSNMGQRLMDPSLQGSFNLCPIFESFLF